MCVPVRILPQPTSCRVFRHFIQQATTEKKRNAAAAKRPRTSSMSSSRCVSIYLRNRHLSHLPVVGNRQVLVCKYPSPLSKSAALMRICGFSGPVEHMAGSPMPGPSQSYQPVGTQFPQQEPSPRVHPITPDTQTRDLLTYIFSPPADTRFVLMQRFTCAFLLISDKLSVKETPTRMDPRIPD